MTTFLPPEAIADINKNYVGARKPGAAFYLIPAKSAQKPPWVIVDKPTAAAKRMKDARMMIRHDPALKAYFKLSAADGGDIHRVARTLVFVCAEPPKSKIQKLLSKIWAKALKGEDDIDKKFCVLLQGAVVRVDAHFDPETFGLAEDEASDQRDAHDELAALDPAALAEFFGPAVKDVLDAAPEFGVLNAKIQPDFFVDQKAATTATRVVQSVIDVDLFDGADTATVVASFLGMAHSTSAEVLGLGSEAPLTDKVGVMASRFNDWWRQANWLDEQYEALDDIQDEVDVLREIWEANGNAWPERPPEEAKEPPYEEVMEVLRGNYNSRVVATAKVYPHNNAEYRQLKAAFGAWQEAITPE